MGLGTVSAKHGPSLCARFWRVAKVGSLHSLAERASCPAITVRACWAPRQPGGRGLSSQRQGEAGEHKFQGDHPRGWKATHQNKCISGLQLSIWKEAPYPWREGEVSGFPVQSSLGIVGFYRLSLLCSLFCSLDFLPLHCEKCPLSIVETLSGVQRWDEGCSLPKLHEVQGLEKFMSHCH